MKSGLDAMPIFLLDDLLNKYPAIKLTLEAKLHFYSFKQECSMLTIKNEIAPSKKISTHYD